MSKAHKRSAIGWGPWFHHQLSPDELGQACPYRVMEARRGQLTLFSGEAELTLSLKGKIVEELGQDQIAVGDWLIVSKIDGSLIRILERTSLIKRLAAGSDGLHQMVAANIDTLFIVTSCNDDFNLSRLERYLAIAYASGVYPVIILTKKDMTDDAQVYVKRSRTLGKDIAIRTINAHDPSTPHLLQNWCKAGQTIALVGSSGVGKSTLVNTLGAAHQKTGEIREGDSKGRHTTTHRSLQPIADGPILLDSPGMRGIGLVDAESGLEKAFEEIVLLSQNCRFSDCQHDQEPGCAITEAINNKTLTLRRVNNYNKLMAEQKWNSMPEIERRTRDKAAAKAHKKAPPSKRSKRKSQHFR